jgi:prepilin-type N-terminal cleavage/methylation domain-containing protein
MRKKSQKGFTLVEVIVVAVIVAVLAAVAIPLYLNYIQDSRLNAVTNAAGSVCSFAGACINSGGTIGGGGAGVAITCSANTTTIMGPAGITIDISAPPSVTATHDADPVNATHTCTYQ